MQYVLGVDGGNTKTIALVATLDGRIVGAGRGGCGDIYNALDNRDGPDSAMVAIANIEYVVRSALQAAHVEPPELVAAVFNMAGADWPEDFAFLQAAIEARGFGRTVIVQNDAMAVLHPASPDDTGVSVICGTGAATGARGPGGRTWHSSFWQGQIQGSAQLGQKTLDAVYRSELGIEPPTTLTPRVLDFFELKTVEELLHLFTSRVAQLPDHRGRLTPILLDEAHAGDSVARQIVEEHGRALGKFAQAAARIVGLEGTVFPLVLAGGVFRHPSPLLANTIIETVRATSPAVRPTRYPFEPIIGVLFTALETAGVPITDALLEQLLPTIPPSTLFATTVDYGGHREQM